MDDWDVARMVPVTRDQLIRMGVDDVDTVAKLKDDIWGLGDDAYGASLDMFHILHCLNSIRKRGYKTYYPDKNPGHAENWMPGDPWTMDEIHYNHCVDLLAQNIQCSGNLALTPWYWVETQSYPFPDSSIKRQCVDFQGLERWRMENTIDMDKWQRVMGKPEGVKQRPAPDAYYIYKAPGEVNPNHINGANPDEDFVL